MPDEYSIGIRITRATTFGVRLLASRKALKKNQLPRKQRDEGPDFCIQKGRRKIWVEVTGRRH